MPPRIKIAVIRMLSAIEHSVPRWPLVTRSRIWLSSRDPICVSNMGPAIAQSRPITQLVK
jgi:hypothetical protein